jgi:uracil DNA glycosylase
MYRLNAKAKGQSFHFGPENRVYRSIQNIFRRLEENTDEVTSTASRAERSWQIRGAQGLRPSLGFTEVAGGEAEAGAADLVGAKAPLSEAGLAVFLHNRKNK